MKQLRAFLYARAASGEWASTPFRDFEPFFEAVTTAIKEASGAAIHIGFWRPDTANVAALASQHPGTLLITDAAAGALPPPVAISVNPVGVADSVAFRLVLSGFGYEIEDPTKASTIASTAPDTKALSNTGDSHAVTRGWVSQLAESDRDLASQANRSGIWDEDSYRAKEQNLMLPLRHRLAVARYVLLANRKPNEQTILSSLYACPYWFLNLPLVSFDLTVRQANVFRNNAILTVSDVAAKGESGLYKLPNLGRGSIHGFGVLLYRGFIDGKGLHDTTAPHDSFSQTVDNCLANRSGEDGAQESWLLGAPLETRAYVNFADGLSAITKSLPSREKSVLAARMGHECNPMTLQEIAEQLGLTRERVRQVERKAFSRIAGHRIWRDIEQKLEALLAGRTTPLMLGGLSVFDDWFAGSETMANPFSTIFDNLCEGRFHVFDIGSSTVISHLSENEWQEAIRSGRAMLDAYTGEGIDEHQARALIDGQFVGKGEELRDDLWAEVTQSAIWVDRHGMPRGLAGLELTGKSAVLAILESSDIPLHYSEICKRVVDQFGRLHEERYVRSAANAHAIVYGRGTYGLMSHCPLTVSERILVRAEVEDLVAEGDPNRQWHCSELFEKLLERGLDFEGRLSKYIVNIALTGSETLVDMRRMVWGSKNVWDGGAASRLDLRQAIISLIEIAGRPMSTAEVRSRLRAERGLNNIFTIFPNERLARVAPGMWGLLDRDVDMEAVTPLVHRLVSKLGQLQHGLHVSEVCEAIGLGREVQANELHPILALGSRFGLRLDRWRNLFLDQWGDSRRVGLPDAVQTAIDEKKNEGASFEFICARVCELIQRDVPRNHISHALQNLDTKHDADTALWWPFAPESDNGELEEESA